jgi:hypothetical protein
MNGEFPLARRAARDSRLGDWLEGARAILIASWLSSAIGGVVRYTVEKFHATAVADRIRWIAITIATASIAHLGLRSLLSSTVIAALPTLLFAGTAALGAVVAWQAAAFERAWRER